MKNKIETKSLCSKLLVAYGIFSKTQDLEIENLKTYRSNLYGFCNIYSFRCKNRYFLVSDDYSLMDEPRYIRAVFEEVAMLNAGSLIKNPVLQSDGAKYALGLDGTEYYLWESKPV